MADTKQHSALSVSNVKTSISVTLDLENGQYLAWAALFKNLARVHDVLSHIIPPTDPAEIEAYQKAKAADLPLWKRLDAAVLNWIYSTVTNDLLFSVLRDDDTAAAAWQRVANKFQDNKNSRALYLTKELANINMVDFSNSNAYCTRLKSVSDQLAGVGSPAPENSLVLRLLDGLPDNYKSFQTIMHEKKKLPDFDTIRSKLALAETTEIERAKKEAQNTALAASANSGNISHPTGQYRSNSQGYRGSNGQRSRHGYGGQGRFNGGRGYGDYYNGFSGGYYGGRGSGRGHYRQSSPAAGRFHGRPPHNQTPWGFQAPPQQWVMPPCPYPTQPWSHQAAPPQPGILGSRPPQQQAYTAEPNDWTATDIDTALHTMTLSPPPWFMDTGATSHMTSASDGAASNAM